MTAKRTDWKKKFMDESVIHLEKEEEARRRTVRFGVALVILGLCIVVLAWSLYDSFQEVKYDEDTIFLYQSQASMYHQRLVECYSANDNLVSGLKYWTNFYNAEMVRVSGVNLTDVRTGLNTDVVVIGVGDR